MDFSETDQFERMLLLESPRMRTLGATVVITARLNGAIADTLCRLRRLGPAIRFYFAATQPDAPEWLPFISRMQQADIEVCYVRV